MSIDRAQQRARLDGEGQPGERHEGGLGAHQRGDAGGPVGADGGAVNEGGVREVEGDAAESDRYDKMQEDAMALVTLSYNIFDGGRRRAEIKRANYQVNEADFKLQDTLIETETAFANAWNELTSTNERIYLLQTHRDAMEAVASAYHEQFELGKRPLINLLDVENELSSARASVEEERLNRLQAAYRLLAAMGELTNSIR